MVFFDYAFAAIPMLGILIFVHEFGHFIVAKLCGVRVLRFSLGFGSPIGFGRHRLRWERGGTEYVVAWVPLGGFVRLLGESIPGEGGDDAPEALDARPDEFLEAKPVWQKIAIVLAGPMMNLVLPVLIFMVMLWVGIPKASSVIGMVERHSPAAEAGLRVGDQILSIDGQPVAWWNEVDRLIEDRAQADIDLVIERGGQNLDLRVPVGIRSKMDEFGDAESIGGDLEAVHARNGIESISRGSGISPPTIENWKSSAW